MTWNSLKKSVFSFHMGWRIVLRSWGLVTGAFTETSFWSCFLFLLLYLERGY